MEFRFGSRKPALLAREDWILLSLAVAKRNINSVQLQKLLCLLGQQFPKLTAQPFYTFGSLSAGQFSVELQRDANLLAMVGQIGIDAIENGREYRLTAHGAERVRDLESRADPEAFAFLRRTAAWVRTRSVDQLMNGAPELTTTASAPPKKGSVPFL